MARSSSSTAPPNTSRCRSSGMLHAARTAHMSEPTCVDEQGRCGRLNKSGVTDWPRVAEAAGRPEPNLVLAGRAGGTERRHFPHGSPRRHWLHSS
eukprot:scaffold77786_cov48-Phaeocystis_antarctica.AAC.1